MGNKVGSAAKARKSATVGRARGAPAPASTLLQQSRQQSQHLQDDALEAELRAAHEEAERLNAQVDLLDRELALEQQLAALDVAAVDDGEDVQLEAAAEADDEVDLDEMDADEMAELEDELQELEREVLEEQQQQQDLQEEEDEQLQSAGGLAAAAYPPGLSREGGAAGGERVTGGGKDVRQQAEAPTAAVSYSCSYSYGSLGEGRKERGSGGGEPVGVGEVRACRRSGAGARSGGRYGGYGANEHVAGGRWDRGTVYDNDDEDAPAPALQMG